MQVLPVTFSLAASFLSSFTLLGLPAEVYTQGTQFLAVLVFTPITALAVVKIFLPVFYKLQAPSSFHFLELRFNSKVRLLAASLSSFNLIFVISIIIYLPALALEELMEIDVDIACIILFVVCVFYTTMGGIKAVIWTDLFQLFFMFIGTASVIFLGNQRAGGVLAVLETNSKDNRIQFFNMAFDPRERHTIWGTMLGAGFQWCGVFAISQMQVQRYLALPSLTKAKQACILSLCLMTLLVGMVGYMGLLLYALYVDCAPLVAGQVKKQDQLVPFMVLDIASDLPGLPGLFMAGVISGSLSTISSGLNALAAVALRDFVPDSLREKMGPRKQALVTKLFCAFFGLVAYAGTFLIRFFPGMLEVGTLVSGAVNGPILGLFLAGMLLPWVNSRGALLGFLTSTLVTGWIAVGNRVYSRDAPYKSETSPPFPNSTVGCPPVFQEIPPTDHILSSHASSGHLALYDISYIWSSLIGASLVLITSLIYSCLGSSQDINSLDAGLIAPGIYEMVSSASTSTTTSGNTSKRTSLGSRSSIGGESNNRGESNCDKVNWSINPGGGESSRGESTLSNNPDVAS